MKAHFAVTFLAYTEIKVHDIKYQLIECKYLCFFAFAGGMPYPGWNEWKVVYELKVNKYRMPQPEHVSEEL